LDDDEREGHILPSCFSESINTNERATDLSVRIDIIDRSIESRGDASNEIGRRHIARARLTKHELNCRACGFLALHIPPSLQSLAQETPSKAVRRPATQGRRQWLCDAHHGCSKRPPIDRSHLACITSSSLYAGRRVARATWGPDPPWACWIGALWSIVAPRSVCIEGRTATSDDAKGSSIILVSAASGRGGGRIAHGVALLLFIGAALCRVEPSCVGGRRVGGQGSQQEPRRAPRAMVPLGRAGLG